MKSAENCNFVSENKKLIISQQLRVKYIYLQLLYLVDLNRSEVNLTDNHSVHYTTNNV